MESLLEEEKVIQKSFMQLSKTHDIKLFAPLSFANFSIFFKSILFTRKSLTRIALNTLPFEIKSLKMVLFSKCLVQLKI